MNIIVQNNIILIYPTRKYLIEIDKEDSTFRVFRREDKNYKKNWKYLNTVTNTSIIEGVLEAYKEIRRYEDNNKGNTRN